VYEPEEELVRKRILLALGDAGSAEYAAACLERLDQHFDFDILADPEGAAIGVLRKRDVDFREWDGSPIHPNGVSLILCGTCGKAQKLWRAATLAGREHLTNVAWFGDFFGSGSEPALADLSPDHFAAFDRSSADRFLTLRPAFDEKYLRIVGNPSFDSLREIARLRARQRALLELTDEERLVYYAASSLGQFALEETLTLVAEWTKKHGHRFVIAFHPADQKSAGEEVARLRAMLTERLGPKLLDPQGISGVHLSAAADLVVTDYSTEGVKAALMGVPTAFVMLESAQAYQRSRGGVLPFFPILDQHILALGVFDAKDIWRLSVGLTPIHRDGLKHVLKRPSFRPLADGKAGKRFVEFVRAAA
jgi:hypothetical protein